MNPERQRDAFHEAQRNAAAYGPLSTFVGQEIETIGDSLYCYVPRLLRHLRFEQLLTTSYAEVACFYDAGSWAIDDLIRLLERIADEVRVGENEVAAEFTSITIDGKSPVGSKAIHSISLTHSDEFKSVTSPDSPTLHGHAKPTDDADAILLDQETASCANDEAIQAEFDSMRQVLLTHANHPLMDEELREFLEPGDKDIPTEFLSNSVCEVLQTPFVRFARRWVGRGRVRCLLNLAGRALSSMQSLTGYPDENATIASDSLLRRRTEVVPRKLHVDGESWRVWCDAIHLAGLQRLNLGMVAESLSDFPTGLWFVPLAHFTTSSLANLANFPGVGLERMDFVIASVRSLALELMELPHGTSIRLKFIPGALRNMQDWLERTLESRVAPDLADLTIQVLRPLAWQLQHDLTEREAQIAIRRLRLEESSIRPTLEELAAVYEITRERVRQLEQWGPRVLQVRFPQGRYLLEALYRQLIAIPGAQQQASLVRHIVIQCFESDIAALNSSSDVAMAWDEAGRLRLTPMTGEQVLEWSRQRLPMFAPNAVLEAIRSHALCLQLDGRESQWFTQSEIDRILFILNQQRGPVRLGELELLDKLQNGGALADADINPGDTRSLWSRIRRDPRFVECDDHHLLLPSENCGFERLDAQWMIRVSVRVGSDDVVYRRIPLVALARLVSDGMKYRGIVDATVSGVHRFASKVISQKFRAQLSDRVTPLVLADMLVKLSDGLIRPMRRRRLRWDGASTEPSARGKWGWVRHVVSEFGRPLVLSELDGLLREHYQDYAEFVINQLTTVTEEDGENDDRVQFISGLGDRIPILVMPTDWELSTTEDNVSEGVLEVARMLATQVRSQRFVLSELSSVNWLMTLVERCLAAPAIAPGQPLINGSPNKLDGHQAAIHQYRRAEPDLVQVNDRESPVEVLIGDEFSSILERTPSHRPWSLAELALVDSDVERLKALFERASSADLRRLLSRQPRIPGYSQDALLGAVLLLFESELARRHASEGRLWSAIHQQVAWRKDTNRFLFNQHQPNARHKVCLEAATRELRLRSAFGEDSAQEWYQSVFLQCGFSKRSFESRLPEWLAGQNTPVSVHRLLSDARYASPSFKELWTALQEYRHGKLERPRLKSVLESSSWVLPEWHNSLIQLARTELKSVNADDDQPDAPILEGSLSPGAATSGTAFDGRFLSKPRLHLSPSGLEFVCDVVLTELPEPADDACDVMIDGQVLSTLLLQVDGSILTTRNEIKLPSSSSVVAAELRTRSGELIAAQTVALWDDSDDVDGYVVKTGRRISPWSREFAERECLLIFTSDMRIEPSRLPIDCFANGARTVVRLLPHEAASTQLFLGDELLWEPAAPTHPGWRDQVHAEVELWPRESPTQFRIRVAHPHAVVATSLRFRRALLEISRDSDRVSGSDWIPLDSEIRSAEAIAFTVLLRSGDQKTKLRHRVPFRPPGNLWRRGDRWEQVPIRATSDLRELRLTDFRLSPPESEVEEQRWQVFEGRRWIASVSDRPQRLTDVEGWGAPLVLRTGPYNSCQPELPLLRGISDSGLIRGVTFEGEELTPVISLDRTIEPDESHVIVVLDSCGDMTFVEGAEFVDVLHKESNGSVWKVPFSHILPCQRVTALAIAYNGERLGSWWHTKWTDVLRRPSGPIDESVAGWASRVADVVRWLRLPLLAYDNLPQVREFATAFAAPVLATWLSRGQLSQLSHDAVGEGWLCVVRAIFADWLPSPIEARELDAQLESVLSDSNALPLKATTTALAAVSPLLAARVVRGWLADASSKGGDARHSRAIVGAIRQQLIGSETSDRLALRVAQDVARSDEPLVGTLDFVRDSLLANCLKLLDQPNSMSVTDVDRSNIEIAMRLEPFRTLVLTECLGHIGKELV